MSATSRTNRLVTALSLACVLVVAGVSVAAWWPLNVSPPPSGTAAAADLTPLPGQVGRLHSVPTLMPHGLVETYFAQPDLLEDESRVRSALAYLAGQVGGADAMPAVLAALGGLEQDPPEGEYPFRFPELESAVAPLLSPDALSSHRDELHEMAALALLAASRHDSVVSDPGGYDGALAYELLRALAQDPGDCPAHLDLAALVSMGQFPSATSVDETFSAAVEACPDDPTARWWWVQVQAGWAQAVDRPEATGVDRAEAMERPLRTARAWQDDEPGSALAWAGEGEALVGQAERMAAAGIMPFTVRARARTALERFRTADVLEHDPALLVGQARALSVLGEADLAADQMDEAAAQAPTNADYHALDVTLLERAHRFADAARVAAADPGSFTPASALELVPEDFDVAGLVGLGTTERTPVTIGDPTVEGQGAGGVDWLGYIPDYRQEGPAGLTSAWCTHRTELRDLLLAGQPQAALDVPVGDPADCDTARGVDWDPDEPSPYGDDAAVELRAMALEALGDPDRRDAELAETQLEPERRLPAYFEQTQNLWRSVGDLTRAASAAEQWVDEAPSPIARVRLGEVLFLQGHYDDAADQLGAALESEPDPEETGYALDWTTGAADQARLAYGTALERAGHTGEAGEVYRDLAGVTDVTGEEYGVNVPVRLSIASAQARLGLLALSAGDEDEAVRWLEPAATSTRELEQPEGVAFDPVIDQRTGGAEANNLAVALLGQDDVSSVDAAAAGTWARSATAHDPDSPIYGDTLALALQSGGDRDGAVAAYREALDRDPTLYQSWNNLGVLLAEQGRRDPAVAVFRRAVAVRPDYALAWFNLGVELGRGGGPRDFLDAQRAQARAVRLDGSYRGRSDTVQKDASVVLTGVDVSRPVAADWTFADTVSDVAPGLSVIVLLVALWRLLLALGLDQVGGWVGGRVLRRKAPGEPSRAWHAVDRFPALGWALAAGVLVVGWPMARGADGQWWQLSLVAVALASTMWLYVAAARRWARRVGGPEPSRPVHRGWAPGIVFGAISSLVGYAFVPVPVTASDRIDHRVRGAGLVALSVVAGSMLALGLLSGAPVARLVGVGALAMLSTALFPLKPYDGGYQHHRGVSAASSVVLIAVSSALVLGWL